LRNLNKLLKGDHILGLTNVSFEKDRICSASQARKQVGVPHPSKSIVTTIKPLELLHMDLFGPVAYISIGGNKYGLVIIDDYSHFTWVYTRQQNGIIERKNRTLIEAVRTMLDEYKVSNQFWTEAINTVCHTINHLDLHKILNKTAYEVLLGKKPNVFYLRVFGRKCFTLNKKPKNSKFAPKVDEGFLLGYA
jgi:hypothetical protein